MLRIKELRQAKGLSQQRLADRLDISQSAVNSYENGINEPDIAMLRQIAGFFEVSVDYLIGHADLPHKIERTAEAHLNGEEMNHITIYRSLPKTIRADVDKLIADIQELNG